MEPATNNTGAATRAVVTVGVAAVGNTGTAATVRTAGPQSCCRASLDLPPSVWAAQQPCVSRGSTQLVSHSAADQDIASNTASRTLAATERTVICLILARRRYASAL